MNSNSGCRFTLIVEFVAFLVMCLSWLLAIAGFRAAQFLFSGLENKIINVGALFGVNSFLSHMLYAVITFFIGIAIVTALFWRIYLKKTGKLFTQYTFANYKRYTIPDFARKIPAYLALSFFGALTWFSAELIINGFAMLYK